MNRKLIITMFTCTFVFIMGCDYLSGVKKDEQNCSAGDMEACFSAGVAYSTGHTVDIDHVKAASLLEKAATSGHTLAQVNYASLCEMGIGVKQDTYTAYIWYRAASLKGNKIGLQKIKELEQKLSNDERKAADIEASKKR